MKNYREKERSNRKAAMYKTSHDSQPDEYRILLRQHSPHGSGFLMLNTYNSLLLETYIVDIVCVAKLQKIEKTKVQTI